MYHSEMDVISWQIRQAPAIRAHHCLPKFEELAFVRTERRGEEEVESDYSSALGDMSRVSEGTRIEDSPIFFDSLDSVESNYLLN